MTKTLVLVGLVIHVVLAFPVDKALPAREENATNSTESRNPMELQLPSVQPEETLGNFSSIEELPDPEPYRMDYFDLMESARDDDDMPALPDRAINVNEDYAGIYDYKGSRDGHFRRKRTIVTNLEQALTRTSKYRRSKRSVQSNNLGNLPTAQDQAENLMTLLSVMQIYDPEFDVDDFLRTLGTTAMTEKDLANMMILSRIMETDRSTSDLQRPNELSYDFVAENPLYASQGDIQEKQDWLENGPKTHEAIDERPFVGLVM